MLLFIEAVAVDEALSPVPVSLAVLEKFLLPCVSSAPSLTIVWYVTVQVSP